MARQGILSPEARAAALLLAFAFVSASLSPCRAELTSLGCPACGSRALRGARIATVHPGEPSLTLFDAKTAEECAALCAKSSKAVLYYQFAKGSEDGESEASCSCLATCYGVETAESTAVAGSLCRQHSCPATCSNAPTPNLFYVGKPARVISPAEYLGAAGANGTLLLGNFTLGSNFTIGGGVRSNFTFFFGGNGTVNGSVANGTLSMMSAYMTFDDCRALAASSWNPSTPYFSHFEASGSCFLFTECRGVVAPGTNMVKSGSFCLPPLLRLRGVSATTSDDVDQD